MAMSLVRARQLVSSSVVTSGTRPQPPPPIQAVPRPDQPPAFDFDSRDTRVETCHRLREPGSKVRPPALEDPHQSGARPRYSCAPRSRVGVHLGRSSPRRHCLAPYSTVVPLPRPPTTPRRRALSDTSAPSRSCGRELRSSGFYNITTSSTTAATHDYPFVHSPHTTHHTQSIHRPHIPTSTS